MLIYTIREKPLFHIVQMMCTFSRNKLTTVQLEINELNNGALSDVKN